MNRELISKALNGIEENYLVECMTYRGKERGQAPERNPKMGKYVNETTRPHSRRLLALILAACLIFALATTAYAANLFGIREMFKTPNRELPEAAEAYIQPQTEAAQGENWSCRITESLCDSTKVMVTVTVSGGDQYILAPEDANPEDQVGIIGLTGDQTLEEYAQSQGKKLLFVGASVMQNEDLGIYTEAQRFENSAPGEMNILIEASRTASASAGDAVCRVYAREADGTVKNLELPFTLTEAPASEGGNFVPVDPDAIPGMTVGEATVTESPLGISVRIPETITDQDAYYDIMKVEIDGITYSEGGSVLEDDGNWYLQISMGQGTVTDTLTVHYYDWDKQPIGDIVFKRK